MERNVIREGFIRLPGATIGEAILYASKRATGIHELDADENLNRASGGDPEGDTALGDRKRVVKAFIERVQEKPQPELWPAPGRPGIPVQLKPKQQSKSDTGAPSETG